MARQKRVAAIHDISGFGKCSHTVALPIISAAGIETSVIPTAVLSTHTGGFTGFTYRDLTEDIRPIAEHWKSLDLNFDSIYTGFLGSFEQIQLIAETFDRLKSDRTLILVDPVMADNGKLYEIFPSDFPKGMKKLCEKADIIIPNITEATLMLDEPYFEGPYTHEYIDGLLKRLAAIGADRVVLTGVYFDNKELGAASYDKKNDQISYAFADRIEGYYHGTGDVFGSAFLAALLNDKSLSEATQIAVNYTVGSIQRTKDSGTDLRFGVNFEAGIPAFLKSLGLI
ncbi:MAG: pyridoxamine kinase [Bacillota bacterium]|nr:pyridoxamine kinase [Bacillota bacterium]